MPGAVPRISTCALSQAALPPVEQLAERGLAGALTATAHPWDGLTVFRGAMVRPEVAQALGYDCRDATLALRG